MWWDELNFASRSLILWFHHLTLLHFFHLHTPLIQCFEGSYPLPNSEVPISQVLTQLQLPRNLDKHPVPCNIWMAGRPEGAPFIFTMFRLTQCHYSVSPPQASNLTANACGDNGGWCQSENFLNPPRALCNLEISAVHPKRIDTWYSTWSSPICSRCRCSYRYQLSLSSLSVRLFSGARAHRRA